MQNTREDTIYVTNPDVVLREEDTDGALLFNPDTNDVKVINNTGAFIWEVCQKGKTLEKIIVAVKDNFDKVPEDKVETEVKDFIEALVKKEFIGVV